MPFQKVRVGGNDGQIFQLPEGLSFEKFNWGRTFSILQDGIGGPFNNGAKVIDSFDIRLPPSGKSPAEAVTNMLVRHGATPLNPNGAVA